MFINKPKCIWTGLTNCGLLIMYVTLLTAAVHTCADAFSNALTKSDCDYAERTLSTLEHNKSRFGYSDYLRARKPHEKFIELHCKQFK